MTHSQAKGSMTAPQSTEATLEMLSEKIQESKRPSDIIREKAQNISSQPWEWDNPPNASDYIEAILEYLDEQESS